MVAVRMKIFGPIHILKNTMKSMAFISGSQERHDSILSAPAVPLRSKALERTRSGLTGYVMRTETLHMDGKSALCMECQVHAHIRLILYQ